MGEARNKKAKLQTDDIIYGWPQRKKNDSRQVSTWKYFLRQEVCYFVSVKLFERSSAALTKNDCRQLDNSWQYFLGQGAVHKRHHHLFCGRVQTLRINWWCLLLSFGLGEGMGKKVRKNWWLVHISVSSVVEI